MIFYNFKKVHFYQHSPETSTGYNEILDQKGLMAADLNALGSATVADPNAFWYVMVDRPKVLGSGIAIIPKSL